MRQKVGKQDNDHICRKVVGSSPGEGMGTDRKEGVGTEKKQGGDTWPMESAWSVAQNPVSYLMGTQQASVGHTHQCQLVEASRLAGGRGATGSVEAGGM